MPLLSLLDRSLLLFFHTAKEFLMQDWLRLLLVILILLLLIVLF
jgi:hypothetical protein